MFWRTEKSEPETGVMIAESEAIIDSKFKIVKAPIWNYQNLPQEGLIYFDI